MTTKDEIHIIEEETTPDAQDYRVMVAVANPQNALGMVNTTRELCKAKNAQIELLHMVVVPEQIPISDADQYMWEGKEAIVEAMLYLRPRFPISTTIRYCRNVARGIVASIRQKKIDMLIIGWHGKPKAPAFRLGSTVDPVIERAPCNVVILRDGGKHDFKHILVPLAGGPNGGFALDVANILAEKEGGEITAFTVKRGHDKFNLENFVNTHRERLKINPEIIRIKSVHSLSVVDTILEESEQYDLVVLGCTRRPFIYKVTHESIPEIFARKCRKPLIMVKSAARIESWVKRWI